MIRQMLASTFSLNEERPVMVNGEKFDGYTVTPNGIIYSLNYGKTGKKKPLKPLVNIHNYERGKPYNKLYYCVNLYKNHKLYRFYIARIVACTFIPIPKDLLEKGYTYNTLEINHIDGNSKHINSVYNLEWCTPKENTLDAFNTGLRFVKIGNESPNHKINENDVHEICQLLEDNELGITEIADLMKIKVYYIYNIIYKKAWTTISSQYNIDNHTKRSKPKKVNKKKATFISESDVHDICILLSETSKSIKEISKMLNISKHKINSILYGYSWTKISNQYNFSKRLKKG